MENASTKSEDEKIRRDRSDDAEPKASPFHAKPIAMIVGML